MKKTTKKITASKPKMKKMFAALQIIIDGEDPEDSSFEIIGIYGSKKTAKEALDKAKNKFLLDIDDDIEEAKHAIETAYDTIYDWKISTVKVAV